MTNGVSQSPTTPATPTSGAVEVWRWARDLASGIGRLEEAQASACGLRPPLFRLLSLAAEAGGEAGVVVSQAARVLGLRPQALNLPATELEQAGLLTRVVDAADARARRLVATPAGRERLAPARTMETRLLGLIAQAIPQASVGKLVLQRLVEALEVQPPAAEAGPEA